MALQLLKQYQLGDMTAIYMTDEKKKVGFALLPADMPYDDSVLKNQKIDSLVQVKISGDIYNEAYGMGNSMRNSESVRRMEFKEQKVEEKDGVLIIKTVLAAEGRYETVHSLTWKKDMPYVRMRCSVRNTGEENFDLEMFESFSLSAISPYLEGDGYNRLYLHRLRSVWSQEGRLESIPIEDLQLEPAWEPHAVRCEKFGQVGSMPVNKFFPFAAIEDKANHVFWGAQIAHNASWQMEIYRKDDGLCVSGGLADRDFGHWMKTVEPREMFETPEVIVSAAHTESLDVFTGRLVKAAEEGLINVPEAEKELPIIFNEYCTTWGEPSHENICRILDVIKNKGFQYFVIDCGWYRQEGVPWDISMGDYEVSDVLFSEGLETTVQRIKDAGMIPGIWFEIETVGKAARAYGMTEHLLKKDGKVITSYFRRFWNMCDPWVENYLTEKVIGTMKKYGFGYMKIDYNETIGIGCDGAESLGEGLRRNMEAAAAFYEKIKREIPAVVLENCASGGHRLEPGLMSQMSMGSFSDAHECLEIPVIVANLHKAVHPAQSQIWAVVRQKDSLKRIAYSVAATFLGRMCISGDVTELSGEQWDMVEEGMKFYKEISPIIRSGQSYRFGTKMKSVRHPEGWQVLIRIGENGEGYAVMHVFGGEVPESVEVELPVSFLEKIRSVYPKNAEKKVCVCDGRLKFRTEEEFEALAVKLA
ncbi:MAG: alpha-galactosidase [Dorea sp.]|nr:alpha-galactosidase [Dorea sp.]